LSERAERPKIRRSGEKRPFLAVSRRFVPLAEVRFSKLLPLSKRRFAKSREFKKEADSGAKNF
jgi:hypothetical protein